jgi:hypothetical protein
MKGDIGYPTHHERFPSEEPQAVYERARFAQRAQERLGTPDAGDYAAATEGAHLFVGDDDHAPPYIDRGGRDTRGPALEAHDLVHGDRGAAYGHPADDFGRTAALWRALFGWDATAKDVALAMACVKLSRLRATPDHRDSVVDLAGYAETYQMVIDRGHAREVLRRYAPRFPDSGSVGGPVPIRSGD